MRDARWSCHRQSRRVVLPRAFTLLECVVSIIIIATLIGVLLPVLGRARESARRTRCASNLRSMLMATFSYQDANGSRLPYAIYPVDVVDGKLDPLPAIGAFLDVSVPRFNADGHPQVMTGDPWKCPSDATLAAVRGCSYGYIPAGFMQVSLDRDPQWEVTLIYRTGRQNAPLWIDRSPFHRKGGSTGNPSVDASGRNYARLDGSVSTGTEKDTLP